MASENQYPCNELITVSRSLFERYAEFFFTYNRQRSNISTQTDGFDILGMISIFFSMIDVCKLTVFRKRIERESNRSGSNTESFGFTNHE